MSLAVWLGAVRKCSAAVLALDLVLGLSMVRRCSLKRSFKRLNNALETALTNKAEEGWFGQPKYSIL